MTVLRDLLATWENWSAHDVMARAVGHTAEEAPVASALDALRDSAELVALLTGWQWQAVHAARREGTTWSDIATVLKVSTEQARNGYAEVLDRQERILGRDVTSYRGVL